MSEQHITIRQAKSFIERLASRQSLLLISAPGIGKSDIVHQAAASAGLECRSLLGTQIAPEDVSGIPRIVGDAYGAEPPAHDDKFGRVSYTQYEALYARSIGKKVYYLIASNDLARDAGPDLLDQPLDDSDAARADSEQRQQLQRDYQAAVQSTGHIYYAIQSHPETELAVRRLKDELDKLHRDVANR